LLSEVLQLDRNHAGAADLVEQLKRGWKWVRKNPLFGFSGAVQESNG
jgi:hypothetical protein